MDKGKRIPFAVHKLGDPSVRKAYADKLSDLLDVSPSGADLLPEQNLEILKSSFINAAELTLGHRRKKQPDWFLESISTLQPLIDAKKTLLLATGYE